MNIFIQLDLKMAGNVRKTKLGSETSESANIEPLAGGHRLCEEKHEQRIRSSSASKFVCRSSFDLKVFVEKDMGIKGGGCLSPSRKNPVF